MPTVTIVVDWFFSAARAQAKLAGIEDLRVVSLPYVGKGGQGHWMSREEREAMLDSGWAEIIAAVTTQGS